MEQIAVNIQRISDEYDICFAPEHLTVIWCYPNTNGYLIAWLPKAEYENHKDIIPDIRRQLTVMWQSGELLPPKTIYYEDDLT